MSQVDGSVVISTKIDDAQVKRGFREMQDAAGKWASATNKELQSVTKQGSLLTKALAAGATAFAGFKITGFATDAALAAARFETMGIVIEQVGKNIGKSAAELAVFEKQIRELGISAVDARNAVTQISAAGIDPAFSKQLAEAAQNLATVSGLGEGEALGRLIHGIQTANTVTLRSLGLTVDFDMAQQNLAKAIGKTASELTGAEKAQARTNAALKAAEAYAGTSAAALETATGRISDLRNQLSNLSVNLGQVVEPTLADGVNVVFNAFKGLNDELERMADNGDLAKRQKQVSEAFKLVTGNVHLLITALTAYTAAQRISFTGTQAQIASIRELAQASLQRAQAAHQEAIATQQAAQQRVAALQMERAALAAQTKQIGMTGVAGKQLEAAQRRLIVAQRELAAANLQVTITTTAVDSAAKRATATATLWAAAKLRLAAAGRALQASMMSLMATLTSGPMLFMAAATAVMYLATRQSEASQITQSYAADVAALGESADSAREYFERLEKQIASMNEGLARVQLTKVTGEIEALRGELEKHVGYDLIDIDTGEVRRRIVKPWSEAVEAFLDGSKSAEQAINELGKVHEGLDKKQQKTVERLMEQIRTHDLLLPQQAALTKRLEGQSDAVDKLAASQKAWAEAATRANERTSALVEAFKDLAGAQKEITGKDAAKFLQDYITQQERAGKSADELRKAEVEKNIAFIEGEAAAYRSAAAVVQSRIANEGRIGASPEFIAALQAEYEQLLKNAEAAEILAATTREALGRHVSTTRGTGRSARSASDAIKEIRQQIDELNKTDSATFSAQLQRGLDGIAQKAKEAGVSLREIERLQGEFTLAFATEAIREFDRELMQLEGRGRELQLEDIARKVNDYGAALKASGMEADDAAVKMARYQELLERQVNTDNLQEQLNFLRDVARLSGDYGEAIAIQNKLIERQAETLRQAANPELAEHIALWERLSKLEVAQDWNSGIERSARKFVAEWGNAANVAEKQFDAVMGTVQDIGSGLIDTIFDGAEFRLDKFFKSLMKQLMQIAMNQMFAQILSSFFPAKTAHTGGIIGVPDANPVRRVSPLAFLGAPRYHTGGIVGLASNEVPAILQRGEGVFTQAQMRALGAGLQRNNRPINNIHIHTPPGAGVEKQEHQNAMGGFDTEIFIEMIDNAIAGGISSGRSQTAKAISMRGL